MRHQAKRLCKTNITLLHFLANKPRRKLSGTRKNRKIFLHPLYYLWEFNIMDIMQTRTELSKTKHSRKSSYSFKVRPLVGKIQTKFLPRATLIHFSDVRINYFEVWPEFQKETWKPRSQNYNPGLNCLLWTSQLVFNLMRWSSSMRPIKLTVTGLIRCGREINHPYIYKLQYSIYRYIIYKIK